MADFTLQILHTSDQEAGIPALEDAIALSAVMEALEDDFDNTLKLTSGDLYIAGPFYDASRSIYDLDGSEANQPGVADILIQNELGWDAAAVGNHEFDSGDETFFDIVAPNPDIVNGDNGGVGIDDDEGYPGTQFPYLASNLDYSEAELPEGVEVVDGGGSPQANSLTSSVVIEVGEEEIGVLGAVTPYLPSIANIGNVTMTTGDDITATTAIDDQVDALIENLEPEVEALVDQGINKIVLMTHLQEAPIEQALAQEIVNQGIPIDILIGGGSHRVMASDDTPLREDETQTPLEPYPQEFSDAGRIIYYVNTGANYRYLSRIVPTFNEDGEIISLEEGTQAYATDVEGVDRLYDEQIDNIDEVKEVADPDIVEIVDNLGEYVNDLDGNIFGRTEFFLNGIRESVRSEETNLGNLTAEANDYYAEQYLEEYGDELLDGFDAIDISFKNGGGIRDAIGSSFVPGGGGELVQLPPQANSAVDKEEGDISQLDISNSLRFNNSLTVGTVTAAGLYEIVEHMVSGVEIGSGRFGQVSGLKFSYDPTQPARTENQAGERVQNLVLTDEAGNNLETIVENGELVADPDTTYSVVTLGFLAGGGDSYPDVIENQVELQSLSEPDSLNNADLESGGEQDALAEYLSAFFAEESFEAEDTPVAEDERIQNLEFRSDTVLESDSRPIVESNPVKADFDNDGISDLLWRNSNTGDNGIWFMNDADQGGSFGPTDKVAIEDDDDPNWVISGVGDFNRNGTEDIVWRNFSTGKNFVWLMNGTERRAIRQFDQESDTDWYIGGASDANGDGNPDLFWRNSTTGDNGIWYMDDQLNVTDKVSIDSESTVDWEMVAIDDMNEDDTADIIWRNSTTGENGIWLMGGENGQEVDEIVTIESELNPEWSIRGSGDYNGDGFADLVWRNGANGNNGVWLFNGSLERSAVVAFETETNTDWQIRHR